MQEIRGNLWEQDADSIVITTNGFVKNNGQAVMGRGCALEAARKWPDFPLRLGQAIDRDGNHVHAFEFDGQSILTMPVKHNWWEKADIKLIERSAHELVAAADEFWLREIVVPRPGCGNGQLDWDDVWPVLEPILDDRFSVITF